MGGVFIQATSGILKVLQTTIAPAMTIAASACERKAATGLAVRERAADRAGRRCQRASTAACTLRAFVHKPCHHCPVPVTRGCAILMPSCACVRTNCWPGCFMLKRVRDCLCRARSRCEEAHPDLWDAVGFICQVRALEASGRKTLPWHGIFGLFVYSAGVFALCLGPLSPLLCRFPPSVSPLAYFLLAPGFLDDMCKAALHVLYPFECLFLKHLEVCVVI